MIVFADLKQYCYHFWCAYPALNFPTHCLQLGQPEALSEHLSRELCVALLDGYKKLDAYDHIFFVVLHNLSDSTLSVLPYSTFWSQTVKSLSTSSLEKSYRLYFAFIDPSPSAKYPGWPLRNYLAYLYVRFTQVLQESVTDNNEFSPSIVALVNKAFFQPAAHILSIRHNLRDFNKHSHMLESLQQQSTIFKITFDFALVAKAADADTTTSDVFSIQKFYDHVYQKTSSDVLDSSVAPVSLPSIIGWERNKEKMNRLVPRFVDCSHQMDPVLLSNNALHLNLKLMKWRLVPELNLDSMFNTKCLLLGAGTLGCNIARALLAWGVTNITFLDNGYISYSNPVRQTLYTFEDCLPEQGKRKYKALVAAEALKRIQPSINAKGLHLSIPMPGHTIAPTDIPAVAEDVKQLEQLIEEHDVIFLLMDTRESRWLPTLIAASKHKVIINFLILFTFKMTRLLYSSQTVVNVALGFDTFLVQRHGLRLRLDNEVDKLSPMYNTYAEQLHMYNEMFHHDSDSESVGDEMKHTPTTLLGSQLGCYFCTDVFAPGNVSITSSLCVYISHLILSHLVHPRPKSGSAMHSDTTRHLDDRIGLCRGTFGFASSAPS